MNEQDIVSEFEQWKQQNTSLNQNAHIQLLYIENNVLYFTIGNNDLPFSVVILAQEPNSPVPNTFLIDSNANELEFWLQNINQWLQQQSNVSISLSSLLSQMAFVFNNQNVDTNVSIANPVSSKYNNNTLSPIALKRLNKDWQQFQTLDTSTLGCSATLINDNIQFWQVRLFNFDENSQIALDLKQINMDSIEVEIEFPSNYPFSAPFVHVIQPRIQYLTGCVTAGGIVLSPLLTQQGWSSAITIDLLLSHIRNSFLTDNTRVDMATTQIQYTEQEANAARNRLLTVNTKESTKSQFDKQFVCRSATTPQNVEYGNKIILPASVLEELSRYDLPFPITFEIINTTKEIKSHVGVLEFTSPQENLVLLPKWLMQSLYIEEGSSVQLRTVQLPKGTFVKFQPHSVEFLRVNDNDRTKVLGMLEYKMPNFSALSAGDTIPIQHEDKTFFLNVLETQPATAISLVSEPYLDIKIEFSTPLDFKEEDTSTDTPDSNNNSNTTTAVNTTDTGRTLRGSQEIKQGNIEHSICPNCQRPVPTMSFTLHTNMCYARNTICEKCNKVIEKREKENHMATVHAPVKCECGEMIEKQLVEQHKKSECVHRKITCQYCNYQTKVINMTEHESVCGDQTDLCHKCNKYIKRKDRFDHESTDCSNFLVDDDDIPQYTCTLCHNSNDSSLLLSQQQLIDHVKAEHPTDITPVLCPICAAGKECSEKDLVKGLSTHLQIHQFRLEQKKRFRTQKKPGTGWGLVQQ